MFIHLAFMFNLLLLTSVLFRRPLKKMQSKPMLQLFPLTYTSIYKNQYILIKIYKKINLLVEVNLKKLSVFIDLLVFRGILTNLRAVLARSCGIRSLYVVPDWRNGVRTPSTRTMFLPPVFGLPKTIDATTN